MKRLTLSLHFGRHLVLLANIILDRKGLLGKHTSLSVRSINEKVKYHDIDTWGQCCKNFYGRKLRIFVKSWSVCSWQAIPAYSIVFGKVRSLPLREHLKGVSLG